jgi:phosphate/sulfate permease
MQLNAAVAPNRPVVVATAVVLSLFIAPILGIVLATLLGLSEPARVRSDRLASMRRLS